MKKILQILFCFTLSFAMYAADSTTNTLTYSLSSNAQLAMATPEYPVTAGDIYTLLYVVGSTSYSYNITIDSSYKVRVANLAVVDASGKTFLELKSLVESVVTRNYPLSGVQFVLSTPATFAVVTRGEVTNTAHTSVWALTRLSEVVTPLVTLYSSTRDVSITSANGMTKTYDLFRAQRFGDLKEDPYLRPGDIINVKRLSRSVKLSGAVERTGTYQLLPGENLADLINKYGSGFTPVADTSRIEVVRYKDTESKTGQKLFLTGDDVTADFPLENYDTVTVGSRTDLLPVMYLEGAIGTPGASNPQVSTRIEIRFNQGENYASVIRNYRSSFTTISDTRNAYIVRPDKRIPLDISKILFDSSYRSEYSVMNEDVVVVPFRQFFVTVTGAVVSPGRYAYIPDRDWKYYVALAGGFDKEKNAFDSISIRDMLGNKRHKKEFIEPETIIDAKNSTFVYYFNKYSPVIATTLGIIVTTYTVRDLVNSH